MLVPLDNLTIESWSTNSTVEIKGWWLQRLNGYGYKRGSTNSEFPGMTSKGAAESDSDSLTSRGENH